MGQLAIFIHLQVTRCAGKFWGVDVFLHLIIIIIVPPSPEQKVTCKLFWGIMMIGCPPALVVQCLGPPLLRFGWPRPNSSSPQRLLLHPFSITHRLLHVLTSFLSFLCHRLLHVVTSFLLFVCHCESVSRSHVWLSGRGHCFFAVVL